MVDEVTPLAQVMRDFWKKMRGPFRGGGIRRRLLIWGLSLFWTMLLVVVVAGYSYTERQIRLDAAALQSELASVTGERIRNFVRRKIERFSDNAAALSLYPLGSKEQQLLLGLLVKNDSSFTDASIINSQGMEVVKVSDRKVYFPSDLTDQSNSPKFIKALKGEDFISAVYTSTQAQPYITLAIPLWGAAQSIVGVVSAEADLSFLWEVIGKIHFATAGYAYLVDEHGNLIAHKDATLVLKRMNLGQVDGVKKFLRNPTRSDLAPAREGRGLTGSPVLVTYAPVPEFDWSVILEEPLDAALANVEILKRSALVFLVVGLLIGAAMITWLSRKITRPIQELRRDVATIGAGDLEHRADIRTGDEIEELAAEFNKMTDALQNSYATLEQKVDQRTKEISALYSITTTVNESLALKDILNSVIPKTTEIFRFESIRVFLFNDEGDELELRASFAIDPEHTTATSVFKRGQGVIGRVAETGEPMIFEDIRTDPRYTKLSTTKATLNANLAFLAVFPIKTQARVFGVILFGARSPRKLSDDETRLLTSMSEHLAVAVEKANLFRESETRAQQLSVLNTIGGAVSQSLNLDMVLNAAINKMIESLLPYAAITVRLVNKETNRFEPKAARNISLEEWKTSHEAHDKLTGDAHHTQAVFHDKAPIIIDNVQTDPRVRIPELYIKHGLISYIGVPIIAQEEVLGVLGFFLKEKHEFGKKEVEFLSTLAGQVAIAIYNAELYEKIKNQAAELTEANKAKDEFLSVMSHELRTPLNVISGYTQILSEGVLGEIQLEQAHALKTITFQSQELLRMINEVLQVGSLEAGKVRVKSELVDMQAFLADLRSGCEVLSKKTIPLHWNLPAKFPTVNTDAEKLKHIVQNLINNAIKFTEEGSVTVSVRCHSDSLEFEVKDTGIGMAQETLPSIFQMFRQLDSTGTRSYGGAGVGLYIVKKFVELLNGTIKVESVVDQGSTFTVTIPLNVSDNALSDTDGDLRVQTGS